MRDGTVTKAKLTRTALRLFVRHGVTETTIRDIAKATGVSEGALYRHYPSKDALAWDLFITNFTALAGELDQLQAGESTLKAKLGSMIRHVCVLFDREPDLFTYLLRDQHGHLAKVKGGRSNPFDVLRRAIVQGMAKKEIPRGDPDVATEMVSGIVLQVAVGKIYGRVTPPMSRLADTLASAAWRALRP